MWNTIDGQYRYFSKKGADIQELTNTKSDNGYDEAYKAVLSAQTADYPTSIDKVNLTLVSLRRFAEAYNKKADPSFETSSGPVQLSTRLGGFIGMTNYPYIINPDNTSSPQIGIDFETVSYTHLTLPTTPYV